jgi:hypothetical protein
MSNYVPVNNLDKALSALQRSDAATPDFYRELAEGELWFLVTYHPEVENAVIQLKNGSPLPFARVKEGDGQVVPLYSSEERLNEGLKNGKVPPRTFSAASMPAKQALEIIGKVGLRAIVNKACSTGSIIIPPDLMRALADGTALKPRAMSTGETRQVTLTILNPADYPTNLIQPVFELVRRHKNFRAAWIFGPPAVAGKAIDGKTYYLLLLMDPRDEVLFHDFNMVVQAASKGTCTVEMSLADEKDPPYVASLFKQANPFYVAADYKTPGQGN